jgi:hypothetical protein
VAHRWADDAVELEILTEPVGYPGGLARSAQQTPTYGGRTDTIG